MILKIEFENFFSIKDRVRIDFRAANINTALTRELRHNVIDWNGVPILKSVGLFGPNASGKSNILKAINFCCRMILESHLHNEGAVFDFEPFKFDGWQEKPSSFLIDFVCDNIEYEYSFELTKTKILSESLYHYPLGRRAKVFVRQADGKYRFGTGVISKPADVVLNTSDKNLFLSRASSMNREIAPDKRMRRIALVICEGETEENYLNLIRKWYKSPVRIVSRVEGTRITQALVDKHERGLKISAKDKVDTFLMYDMDVSAINKKLMACKAELLLSNPCFEIWLLLHAKDQKTALSSEAVLKELKKSASVWNNYNKSVYTDTQKTFLREHLENAINRARALKDYQNPSSRIYRLLEVLENKL